MHAFRPFGVFAVCCLLAGLTTVCAQQSTALAPGSGGLRSVSNEGSAAIPGTIEPSWDTRPDDRTLYFSIPAPRGQITDRNGLPLAQSRLGYHLNLRFPVGDELNDSQVAAYVKTQLVLAQSFMRRPLEVTTSEVLDHYHNRRMLPLDIATYLTPEEVETVRKKLAPDSQLGLRTVYLRFYPNGSTAAHIIGYSGKTGGQARGALQPNELLWPDLEGHEGLEKTFNEQLTGKPGVLNMTFDAKGNKTSERIVTPPIPGNTVVTTLDLPLQKLCEQTLAKGTKRGAMVVMDPNTGDVLAMASNPSFDPNLFVPKISSADLKRIDEDPDIPLIPRAFRSTYPAGSTFKIIVGAAALQSRTIDKDDEFTGPTAITLGNIVFHNWKKTDAGDLNFVEALAQSCDTWFYQVGIKTGPDKIIDMARRFGFGQKTGLPLRDEAAGLVPDNEYMKRVHKRKFYDGDTANLSIGQGDLEVTPIQMAQAMATLANGGTFHQTRLVEQVQTLDNGIASAYQVRARRDVGLTEDVVETLKKGMSMVVDSGMGTAHQAHVPGVDVGGKTGTAQWGAGNNDKSKSRTAWWFVGFAPVDKPQYAFAAVVEGDAGDNRHSGTTAVPIIGKVLRDIYKKNKPDKPDRKKKRHSDDGDNDENMDDNAPPADQTKDESD